MPPVKTIIDPNLVYLNGISAENGKYAVEPIRIQTLAKKVAKNPGILEIKAAHPDTPRSFAAPYGLKLENLADVGWGIIFAEGASNDVRQALQPLIDQRKKQVGGLL